MRNYNRRDIKPRDVHIIHKQGAELSNTVLKMPEQHFLLVYARREWIAFSSVLVSHYTGYYSSFDHATNTD